MYSVEPAIWVRVATMYLTDAAALWFPSVESQVATTTWEQFCALVRDRFNKDQHELLVQQLLHICQTSTVTDFVSHTTSLVDQLKAYSAGVDPVYFTSCFIDGLRPELRVSIIVQCPQSLDAACALALLQEDAGGAHDDAGRNSSSIFRKTSRQAMPLPLPPKTDKTVPAQDSSTSSTAESRLAATNAYRKVMGSVTSVQLSGQGITNASLRYCMPSMISWSHCLLMTSLSHDHTPPKQLLMALSNSALWCNCYSHYSVCGFSI